MGTASLAIPADLEPAFKQFARDWAAIADYWHATQAETTQSLTQAREALRTYLAIPDDPDAYGITRHARISNVFAHWRTVAAALPPRQLTVCAVPALSLDAETRIADAHWRRGRGGSTQQPTRSA